MHLRGVIYSIMTTSGATTRRQNPENTTRSSAKLRASLSVKVCLVRTFFFACSEGLAGIPAYLR